MARWILSNVQKKNVLELEYFKHPKHYKPIVIENWWRWGTFECESDEKPDIDLENDDPDAIAAAIGNPTSATSLKNISMAILHLPI